MKIAKLEAVREQADEGAVVTIFDPDGEAYLASDGSEATMTIVGAESKKYRAAKMAQQRALFKKARSSATSMTPEQAEKQVQRLAASAIIGWHGWEDDKGAEQDCSVENVCDVIKYVHIFDQVQAAIQGHSAFFANDSGS